MASVALTDKTLAPPKEDRLAHLNAEDEQFRTSYPLEEVVKAKHQPGMRLAQVVQATMEGYADRPALGQRARELVTDPGTGRTSFRLLPRFETITYGELWRRARAIASEWHNSDRVPVSTGDFVTILGFTSPDYATLILASIHLGAVIVPLQTSAPTSQHAAIIAETEPTVLATGIDYLDAAVAAALAGTRPKRMVVCDYDIRDDDQRERLEAARAKLAEAGADIPIDTFDELVQRGSALPEAPLFVPAEGEDPLAWLFYTSGSTGTPKGAVFTERLVIGTWLGDTNIPAITLSFMPMAHLVGNGYLLRALANGGTSYCSPRADLSTLLEDFSLARPTMASIVPRVCELFYHHYLGEVDKRVAAGADPETVGEEIKREMREEMLGGRLLSVGCGSASLAPETYAFMEDMLGIHMPIGYASTEIAGGTVLVDWKIQRPPVIDYKLADVPELGYFTTDKPYPRGELLVKSDRFIGGYFKQPELTAEKWDKDGYYATGDVMAEMGPDHLVFLDRRNNVIKLSQGEFVAVSKLEALYSHSQDIRQIYIYGTSERAFLVAVIVPSEELAAQLDSDGGGTVKARLRRALQQIAEKEQLNTYEVPREFLIETEPFSLANGLLSEVGKHQRPKLKARYGEELEELYTRMAQDQLGEMRALRMAGADNPVIETVSRALQATLGIALDDVRPDVQFADLGGDSLSALSFSGLLEEIFDVEVPVGVIISPAGNVSRIAEYIETERSAGESRATYARVHDATSDEVRADELKLDKFMPADVLAAAPALPAPSGDAGCVLVTGVTGFLGRFQMISWLERMAQSGGKVICIARGADAAQARQRIEDALDTDDTLLAHFRQLADRHLEVLPGDLGLPDLGLGADTFARLASEVDLIVHPAAHVNHVLPYNQLFGANVSGTAELIRMALTTRLKPFHYVSTLGINSFAKNGLVGEDIDVREAIPFCELNDSYANGYGISKWAGEVLLREAHDLCGLPVAVFRPGMIMAHSTYVGQINVPDMFTRLMFSLIATGIAPATFYAQDLSNGRPDGHYDGLSVDCLADSITAIGAGHSEGFQSYNLAGPRGSGTSLDDFVDWLNDAGCGIERIAPYDEWLSRFETAMHALPEEQKQESMLAILGPYRRPQAAGVRSSMPAQRFQDGCAKAAVELANISRDLIGQYVSGLRRHQLID